MNEITNYFSLPKINRSIGILDSYGKGKVCHIDFHGELNTVWVQYKTVTKAFRTC